MYAVIKTGGKQYRVSPGDKLRVESLAVAEGESVDFDQILMVSDGNNVSIGNPLLSDAVVTGKVVNHGRGCLLYTSPSPRDKRQSRMPSSA